MTDQGEHEGRPEHGTISSWGSTRHGNRLKISHQILCSGHLKQCAHLKNIDRPESTDQLDRNVHPKNESCSSTPAGASTAAFLETPTISSYSGHLQRARDDQSGRARGPA